MKSTLDFINNQNYMLSASPANAQEERISFDSEKAFMDYVGSAPGFSEPRIAVPQDIPSIPGLKLVADGQRAAGKKIFDQSAGDISALNEPMSRDFYEWREDVLHSAMQNGKQLFQISGGIYGFSDAYVQDYPVATDAIVESYGVKKTPVESVMTVSGRAAIDFALRGFAARLQPGEKGAVLLDPLAWPGYEPLAKDLGLEIIFAPVTKGKTIGMTKEGVEESMRFAKQNGLKIVGIVPIIPSNPTGLSVPPEEIISILEGPCLETDTPMMIDGFYSPLDPDGHESSIPMGRFEDEVSPEALQYLGVLAGETKVTSSQKKTATIMWMKPQGQEKTAKQIMGVVRKRRAATNCYPRPDEALTAMALHTYKKGEVGRIHTAMGPRYEALEVSRAAMRKAMQDLGLPFVIGKSFYGTVALVDPISGESYIRGKEGRPIQTSKGVLNHLVEEHGIVGAPGQMFSAAPEAMNMLRVTAAVTKAEIAGVKEEFRKMIEHAKRFA